MFPAGGVNQADLASAPGLIQTFCWYNNLYILLVQESAKKTISLFTCKKNSKTIFKIDKPGQRLRF